jgi:hypothetical protein
MMPRYIVELPDAFQQKAEIWQSLIYELREAIAFAHVDLIPDEDQLAKMGAPDPVRLAFQTLSLAAKRNSHLAVQASSGPAPLGMHIEVSHTSVVSALAAYGAYSIGVDVWRESDRRLLADPDALTLRPYPLIDQIDSMDALLVCPSEDELASIQQWASRSGVALQEPRR